MVETLTSDIPGSIATYGAIVISVIAIVVSVYTYFKTSSEDTYKYLASLWDSVLDTSLEHPSFLNPNTTSHYERVMSDDERAQYDAFCYKLWGCIEDVIVKGFHDDKQFKSILHWTIAYHFRWLQLNPMFFTIDKFWEIIRNVENDPQLIIGYRPLPTAADGDIDWDLVSPEYYRYILSPFAPEMVIPDEHGVVRNTLVRELSTERFGSLDGKQVADFGCGPGNLISHLPKSIAGLMGVDKSQRALELAASVANENSIRFTAQKADISNLELGQTFNTIFCINAILPSSRGEVISILKTIRSHLNEDGQLVAILPSYDTTVYLRELWRAHYTESVGEKHAERIINALGDAKMANDQSSSYADDGRTSQCYHTPETIKQEFAEACLDIERMEKIYYPWDLVRRFDYGYFPNADQEIWDWYIVAKRQN